MLELKYTIAQNHNTSVDRDALLADGTRVVANVPARMVQLTREGDHGTIALTLTGESIFDVLREGDEVSVVFRDADEVPFAGLST